MADLGLKLGAPAIRSVGALAFGPEDVLFVADILGARIFAIDVADTDPVREPASLELRDLDLHLAAFLGCSREDVRIRDMAVHPRTWNVFLSVSRGKGRDGLPLIVKLDPASEAFSEVPLQDVRYAEAQITNAPGEDQEYRGFKMRTAVVSDMAYADGMLFVAGMSNEEFSSNLRRIPFPFDGRLVSNSLQIFHVSHGLYETAAPIRSFIPYGDEQSILASYTCTPLVRFSMAEVAHGEQAKGETVAELGARNMPLDMIAFRGRDREYVLVSNSHHPLMKIAADDIDRQEPLRQPRSPAGVEFEALPHPHVTRLSRWSDSHVLLLQSPQAGGTHLQSVAADAL